MSVTTLRPALVPVTSSWHRSAATLPPETAAPATPFHSRTWSAAWQKVTTEPVLRHQHLHLEEGGRTHVLPFQLIDSSPMWRALELGAGVARPTWTEPVVYAPSMYGEYGGLPGASRAVLAEAVDQGRWLTRDWGATALVVPNLPPSDLEEWTRARPADAQVTLCWAHQAPVHGSLEGFVAAMPSPKVRTEFRRQYKRGTEAGLRLRVEAGPSILNHLPQFTKFAVHTSERHGPALYGMDMLRPLTAVPGAVALLAEDSHGALAGGFLCFRYGQTLYLWAAAIDQRRKRDLHTYGWLMAQSVRYAADTGATVIDAGRANYAYKHRIGLDPVPLTSLVYLTRSAPRLVSRIAGLNSAVQQQTGLAWKQAA
ncbi:GNAT family N-acetyltransferase [Streptomyces sp. NBC_01361]|uniref:GNAT family N-acetyltransferase n=1 Tax=Streptomyces sp. NBC_01361 TaxID=2903838 RepID=UPI002E2FF473|nr:GNAT family N-acetyltransferase [Streptomyces sp. NBC_01361]